DPLEDRRLPLEHEGDQREQHRRYDQDERHGPAVVAQLVQEAPDGGGEDPHAGAPSRCRMRCRNAVSRSSAPAADLISGGVPSAMISPSRMSSSRWHRSASSMTWLVTSTVVPSAARAWKRLHSSSRSTGSCPTVG